MLLVVSYLAVLFDNLEWNAHIDHVLCQIAKGVAMLACVKHYFPINIKRMVYFAFINSYLLYCTSIWGDAASYLVNKLLVMQKRAVRMVYNAHYLAHVNPI